MKTQEITNRIQGVLEKQRPKVIAAYLFGSAVSGKDNRFSDIDLAVLIDPSGIGRVSPELRINLSLELGALLGREVDVIILNNADTLLKYEIYRTGKIIFEKTPAISRGIMAESLGEYYDYQPILRMYHKSAIKMIMRS
ncbi:MAG: nucleotidyltransferase domain-containing protein [Planctomycetota bacterium]